MLISTRDRSARRRRAPDPRTKKYPTCVTVPKGTDVGETNHFDDETRSSHWGAARTRAIRVGSRSRSMISPAQS